MLKALRSSNKKKTGYNTPGAVTEDEDDRPTSPSSAAVTAELAGDESLPTSPTGSSAPGSRLPRPGDKVEIFSNSKKVWCPGKIKSIDGADALITFKVPGAAKTAFKTLALGHKDLRILEQELTSRERMKMMSTDTVNSQQQSQEAMKTMDAAEAEKIASTVSPQLDSDSKTTQSMACRALGSMGEFALPYATKIATLVGDKDDDLRCAAAIALRAIGKPGLAQLAPYCSHKDPNVREVAVYQIGVSKNTQYMSEVVKLLSDNAAGVRLHALEALEFFGQEAVKHAEAVATLLDDKDSDVKALALKFTTSACSRSQQTALKLVDHDQTLARKVAIKAIVSSGTADDRNSLDAAAKCVEDEDSEISKLATDFVRKACRTPSTCITMLKNQSTGARRIATECIMTMGEEGASHADTVVEMLVDASSKTRRSAVVALGRMGDKGAAHAKEVAKMTADADADVRLATIEALVAMGIAGKEFGGDKVVALLQDSDARVRTSASNGLMQMAMNNRGAGA
eukprot:TRINITY_DN47365_c0_g1_i1.p1 TRINITY_DN47365_c0_g1~~TRINITY_DN47365_c0_g1_i1.p1  ORF type:complete len:513 (-),score=121.72 TRINITY_DN47365_c0_g1_i1:98-1636(-)